MECLTLILTNLILTPDLDPLYQGFHNKNKKKEMFGLCCPYRCQLVEAGKKLIEGHDQLLRRALGRQTGETFNVGEQDAAETQKHKKTTAGFAFRGCPLPPSVWKR